MRERGGERLHVARRMKRFRVSGRRLHKVRSKLARLCALDLMSQFRENYTFAYTFLGNYFLFVI